MSETESENPKPSSQPPSPAKPKAKARRAAVVVEETPVISGRFLTAAAVIGTLTILPMSCLGSQLEPKEPPKSEVSEWKVGGKSTLRITLVTADYAGLS